MFGVNYPVSCGLRKNTLKAMMLGVRLWRHSRQLLPPRFPASAARLQMTVRCP